MNIHFAAPKTQTDIQILAFFKNEKTNSIKLPPLALADFKNFAGSTHLVYSDTAPRRILLLGLGDKQKFDSSQLRVAVHSLMQALKNLDVATATLVLPKFTNTQLEQILELVGYSATFSSYQFDTYKKDAKKLALAQLFVQAPKSKRLQKALERGIVIGRATNQARDLANHPGNVATPTHLAQHAIESARKYKFACKVLDSKEIAKEGMGLITGVAAGSDEPPKFIILEYGPKSKPPLVLVGKGLTFDSGGVSIKPADRMEEMKYDMCGGATVLGIFEAVAQLKLPVRLVGLIPSTENLMSGRSVKPGDILKAHDGSSVEIINTDAEGRLVLADAITFAKKYYKPKLIIDYATLTGAVIAALGDQVTGFFANTKSYNAGFEKSAAQTAEKFWPMPLSPEYREQLKSLCADIKNIGEKSNGGAITAALFLDYFVGNTPWIHMDIAGTAWTMRPRPFATAGATGWGVYLTLKFLQNFK